MNGMTNRPAGRVELKVLPQCAVVHLYGLCCSLWNRNKATTEKSSVGSLAYECTKCVCVYVSLCHGTHFCVNSTLSLHSTQGTPGSINQLRRLARRGLLRL